MVGAHEILHLTDKETMTNEINDKRQNAINISDFLRLKHLHFNSSEGPPIPV